MFFLFLQVIAFLYTAMRCVDLGLRTVLIVVPVNVLHNWRKEFLKWRPSEVKPLRVFMLEDVSRFDQVYINFLIYTTFIFFFLETRIYIYLYSKSCFVAIFLLSVLDFGVRPVMDFNVSLLYGKIFFLTLYLNRDEEF